MALLLILLIAIIIIIIISNNTTTLSNVEGFWDKIPYKYHWNIFRCYNEPCAVENTQECYKYCDNLNNVGSAANCRERCLEAGRKQFDYFKLNKYNFGDTMPMLRCGSLLNDNKGDYV